MESFICVDIAQSSQEGLVEQEGLKLPSAEMQGGIQPIGSKRFREWFRPEILEDFSWIVHQPDTPNSRTGPKDMHVLLACAQLHFRYGDKVAPLLPRIPLRPRGRFGPVHDTTCWVGPALTTAYVDLLIASAVTGRSTLAPGLQTLSRLLT